MAFSDPVKVLEQIQLEPGTYVADLGAGSGAYSLAAAHMIGGSGRVFAVDVQADLLARLKNAAHNVHASNVEAVHGDIETEGGTRLAAGSVDLVFLCNVLFQVEQKANCLQEVKRILKPTGRVLLVDWEDSFGGLGPQPEFVMTKDMAEALFERQGFTKIKDIEAGDHHYGIIFRIS